MNRRIPRHVIPFLVAGLLAASQSGNIIRLGTAHPVVIAAWRLLLASLLFVPLAGRRLKSLLGLSRAERWLLLAAGSALALHFFAWIAAVQLTTVANAAIFFSINPVITSLAAALLFKERFGPMLALSISLGLGGVVLTGVDDLDFSLSGDHLQGDGLALLCSALFTTYFLLGKRLRQKLDSRVYVCALYGVAAAFSFIWVAVLDLTWFDYPARTWLCFWLMALVPTMLGHTALNHALRYLPASVLSVSTLSEPVMAGLVAYLAWGEAIGPWAVAGYGSICASVAVLVVMPRAGGADRPAPHRPVAI